MLAQKSILQPACVFILRVPFPLPLNPALPCVACVMIHCPLIPGCTVFSIWRWRGCCWKEGLDHLDLHFSSVCVKMIGNRKIKYSEMKALKFGRD